MRFFQTDGYANQKTEDSLQIYDASRILFETNV